MRPRIGQRREATVRDRAALRKEVADMRSTQKSSPVRGIIRQGEVLLVPAEGLPETQPKRVFEGPRIVLAEGEATGHAHVVQGNARLVRSAVAPHRGVVRTHLVVE